MGPIVDGVCEGFGEEYFRSEGSSVETTFDQFFLIDASVVSRTVELAVALSTASTLLTIVVLLVVAEKYKTFPLWTQVLSRSLNHTKKRRTSVFVGIIMTMAATSTYVYSVQEDGQQYITFSWTIYILTIVTALWVNYLVKFCLTAILVLLFTTTIILKPVCQNKRTCFPSFTHEPAVVVKTYTHLISLLIIVITISTYYARLVEVTSRLYFLWQQKAEEELKGINAARETNMQLLTNVLPDYVAKHFLNREYKNEELYSQYRENIGVLFASIPNFAKFYSEERGLECIRLLNEIIADFDEILDEEDYSCIEKIKTISATATYMAVSGLQPPVKNPLQNSDHLGVLVAFGVAIRQKLAEINKDSFNSFVMRIGVSHGPLVCGVIGAKKPIFDVWGDTVNEASRMDSTGVIGHIQVPKHTGVILAQQGFDVRERGLIKVKGKGLMETCLVVGKKLKKVRSCQRNFSKSKSLGEVVHAIARNRKKLVARSYKY
ncbi:hypothetical protein Zmor_012860 [Zophobas morio]|uniref:adenylate cyclase n=1 Tax=Zophobas morio TaxID=2755281 RepID=A0AA38ICS4_9CUCU|nr:hypothetical protein Zmor_012860 [Zophobas morio]